jgi:hypothetical protein
MVSFHQPNGLLTRPRLSRLHEVQAENFCLLQLLIPDDFAFTDFLKSRVPGSPLLRGNTRTSPLHQFHAVDL